MRIRNSLIASGSARRISTSIVVLTTLALLGFAAPRAALGEDTVESYSVFAGNSIDASGSITSNGSALGSNHDMFLSGANVQTVRLGGMLYNTFGGITATGDVVVDGDAVYNFFGSVGGNLNVGGNLTTTANVAGNIIAGGSVSTSGNTSGSIFAGAGITSSGTVGGAAFPFSHPTPESFTPLAMPPAHTFASGGANLLMPTFANQTLSPGSYGELLFDGSNTVNLSSGNYYFDSIHSLGSFVTFNFDTTHGPVNIFVTGDIFLTSATMNLNGVSFSSIDPANAGQVYWETHGDLSATFTSLLGTVYSPYGDIDLEKLSNGLGNLVAGHDFITDGGTFNFGRASSAIPEPSSMVLALCAVGCAALAQRRLWRQREGVVTTPAPRLAAAPVIRED